MSIDAMKLALEALNLAGGNLCEALNHTKKLQHEIGQPCPAVAKYDDAIKALEEALKQQSLQDLHDENERLGLYEQEQRNVTKDEHDVLMKALAKSGKVVDAGSLAKQEQGEPVAWVCNGVNNTHDIDFDENEINDLPVGTLLYTTPQPAERKRTWVGLTDEEFNQVYLNASTSIEMLKELEARLKEKNT